MMLGKSDRTVRQWRNDFIENGEIIDSKQGKYKRTGVLWSSEELNAKQFPSAFRVSHAKISKFFTGK